ncbi:MULTISPECIES: hypothetical protein [unclassified Halobacteriovorax]|uniref:hypothetical protein n=1 Tax=unclassified Halobacteriovorax TaxID=2639665 RepID=UPI002FEEDA6F
MKKFNILILTFLLTFSALAERGGGRGKYRDGEGRRGHRDRHEKVEDFSKDIAKLSKEDIAKLEGEFNKFQKEQMNKRLKLENQIFDLREKFLEQNRSMVLKHIKEMNAIKSKIKFGNKDANKSIRKELKEKSSEFRKKMKELRHKTQRDEIKKLKKEFKAQMKAERKKFREKIKSYRK